MLMLWPAVMDGFVAPNEMDWLVPDEPTATLIEPHPFAVEQTVIVVDPLVSPEIVTALPFIVCEATVGLELFET